MICSLNSNVLPLLEWKGFDKALDLKLNALQKLNYYYHFRVGVQFSKRFWEDTSLMKEGMAIYGGKINNVNGSFTYQLPSKADCEY